MSDVGCLIANLVTIHHAQDWLEYNQRHHITVSTDSLGEIKLLLDRLIFFPNTQPEGVYKVLCLSTSLVPNKASAARPPLVHARRPNLFLA